MELLTKEAKSLCFMLGNEEYAIEVFKIKEVINYVEVTEIPNLRSFLLGVFPLRGLVIPVFDLKKYLGVSKSRLTKKARIIICRGTEFNSVPKNGMGGIVVGMLIDSVGEVIDISHNMIKPVPPFRERDKVEFFKGIIEYKNRFIILLNIDTILRQLKT